mmetsp:Transcript_39400/g.79564  ORF Transcript_39400/g.79564 Transcript_39400/m.79564 type:complete len:346 (-) Transcript_39400:458-1495(-)
MMNTLPHTITTSSALSSPPPAALWFALRWCATASRAACTPPVTLPVSPSAKCTEKRRLVSSAGSRPASETRSSMKSGGAARGCSAATKWMWLTSRLGSAASRSPTHSPMSLSRDMPNTNRRGRPGNALARRATKPCKAGGLCPTSRITCAPVPLAASTLSASLCLSAWSCAWRFMGSHDTFSSSKRQGGRVARPTSMQRSSRRSKPGKAHSRRKVERAMSLFSSSKSAVLPWGEVSWWKGLPTSRARALSTLCGTRGPTTTGTPGFITPAFSSAISSTVSPRMRVWSSPMDVMTDTVGVTTLVASSRPPKPTSRTTTSAALKWWNASAVVNSKKVAGTLCSLQRS